MKICIITNIPSPYRLPLFERLDHAFGKQGWSLTVIFLTRTYHRRKWEVDENRFRFRYRFLDDRLFHFRESFFSFGISILKVLRQERPNVIILGGFSFPMMLAMLYAKIYAIPYCLWSGETIEQSGIRGDFFQLRKTIRRWIIRHSAGAAVYGNAAKQYMIQMGMPPGNIFIAINTVDTGFFQQKCAEIRIKKDELKKSNGYPKINLLYVGRLTEQKGLQYLFRALKELPDFDKTAALHIVGSGPYENDLKSLQKELSIQNIFYHGFKQKDDLPFFYGISDIFVFPSLYDIWGLVCIEAMAAGMPIICSTQCGLAHDLTHENNAILINPKHTRSLANAIHVLSRSEERRNHLVNNATDLTTTRMNINNSANGFLNLIQIFSNYMEDVSAK